MEVDIECLQSINSYEPTDALGIHLSGDKKESILLIARN